MALISNTLRLIGTLIGDAIDDWATGESRSEIQERLREAAERGAQLALEKGTLEDRVNELRFNGPTLWSDEVDAIMFAMNGCDPDTRRALKRLLDRSDHMPTTERAMSAMADEAIRETGAKITNYDELRDWFAGLNDIGIDVDDPHGDDDE